MYTQGLDQKDKSAPRREQMETPEQLAFLKRRYCDAWQGYLLSKPVPEADARALIGRVGLRSAVQRL